MASSTFCYTWLSLGARRTRAFRGHVNGNRWIIQHLVQSESTVSMSKAMSRWVKTDKVASLLLEFGRYLTVTLSLRDIQSVTGSALIAIPGHHKKGRNNPSLSYMSKVQRQRKRKVLPGTFSQRKFVNLPFAKTTNVTVAVAGATQNHPSGSEHRSMVTQADNTTGPSSRLQTSRAQLRALTDARIDRDSDMLRQAYPEVEALAIVPEGSAPAIEPVQSSIGAGTRASGIPPASIQASPLHNRHDIAAYLQAVSTNLNAIDALYIKIGEKVAHAMHHVMAYMPLLEERARITSLTCPKFLSGLKRPYPVELAAMLQQDFAARILEEHLSTTSQVDGNPMPRVPEREARDLGRLFIQDPGLLKQRIDGLLRVAGAGKS
ncbi:hypothetical protein DFP72DRAFT_873311 [Ephemerocybe angulata]|uniref:Uncharacterized protein n=1 Tax=Ephemerocybe angulata TaxID=980116 RepID=A0A8H6IDU4_9AGAR|nr:hypothetical protein DFP72DRAFT_873311 [Tulosesus angulatus]